MAKSKQPELRQANLTPERMKVAIPKIERRIKEIDDFDVSLINSRSDPKISALSNKLDELLVSIYGADTVEYKRYDWAVTHLDRASMNMMYETPIEEVREGLQEGLGISRAQLVAIRDGFLEEIGDLADSQSITQIPTISKVPLSSDIFIVHGHDDGLKQSVARFIEKLSLNPIILHEQPNQGRTIMEKFEGHSNVGFAVVLLTPDDMGRVKGGTGQPRARQNVVFELGYFIGKLGRKMVAALYSEGVELPSDLSGVIYIKIDAGGAWKFELAKEIKASGINVDLNKAI